MIKLRLANGHIYSQTGKLNFFDNTVSQTTDTITLRGSVANPQLNDGTIGGAPVRELTDGEFVTVCSKAWSRSRC